MITTASSLDHSTSGDTKLQLSGTSWNCLLGWASAHRRLPSNFGRALLLFKSGASGLRFCSSDRQRIGLGSRDGFGSLMFVECPREDTLSGQTAKVLVLGGCPGLCKNEICSRCAAKALVLTDGRAFSMVGVCYRGKWTPLNLHQLVDRLRKCRHDT